MKITRSWRTFILLVMTICLCPTIFVYLESKMHFLKDISAQASASTNNVYSRMEYMDRDDPNESSVNTRRKYSKDLFLEKVLEYRLLLPLKGQLFNPVVRKVVEQLKKNDRIGKYVRVETIDQFAKSHLRPRDTTLSASDLKNIQNCKTTSKTDYQKSYKSLFEGDNAQSQYIRRTHHIYLNSTSFMIEVGGNWGWDAGNFSKLYNMNYIILEPLTPYSDILQSKFYGNEKISVYNIGLGSKNEVVMVNLEGKNACATTKFSRKNGTVPIYIVNAIDFMTHLGIGVYDLDLLTLDCEGCEFEVLVTLVKSNLIEKIRNIQWATHTQISISDPWGRYCRIQELLRRTHHPTYQYKFNWESWRRNDEKIQCIDKEK